MPTGDRLYASADGDTDTDTDGDTDSVAVEYPAEECESFDADDAHALFSVSYLDSVARVVPADASVDVRLGEETPLDLTFDLAGGSVRYVVAPRISRS